MNTNTDTQSVGGRRISRRAMLKNSALAGAGLAAGLHIERAAHAAGSDVLKVGLIGCGDRGSGAAVNALNADANASPCLTSLDASPYGARAEFLVGHYIVVSFPFGGMGGRVSESLSALST